MLNDLFDEMFDDCLSEDMYEPRVTLIECPALLLPGEDEASLGFYGDGYEDIVVRDLRAALARRRPARVAE